MYLWDSNILRHYGEGHPILRLHIERVSWSEIAVPSVVVAEVMRGRCEYALKADTSKLASAHSVLMKTRNFLDRFNVSVFDDKCAEALIKLRQKHKTHKKYPDMMIAAMAQAGKHIVVTRNQNDFEIFLSPNQISNWIDMKPT